ncbi:4-hydroxythreonine-4-phosphate dehydrogenase PdxA [Desulforegula conservatrix]|uniref:4-hydroxythreonine-4-phosphate dehydrogenase PdxA n=1 Tax=Desulforegula conservatrix TaxID=153026 RepID=UPI0003FC828B|nr:4-hydroxythreonine-4-phosphate dehydrogenase PdxA [Desulforegula conservatrix]
MSDFKPLVAITMGDPAGIGPEIVIKALNFKEIYDHCRPFVVGDKNLIGWLNTKNKSDSDIVEINSPDKAIYRTGTINIINTSNLNPENLKWGQATPETGAAMTSYILKAVEMVSKGEAHAMATAPISKYAMQLAGFHYPGHTELIAEKTGCQNFAMMLAGSRIRTALVTIHTPLSKVPSLITEESVLRIIRLTHHSLLSRFGIDNPRIAVAGLNPHAGEGGMFGYEESEIIEPAINRAVSEGINASGPHPPDTVYFHANNGLYDAVVCMYHDQGLIPFKLVHFEDGVNTTLGLPIIRTSVDHGTAYDIAGKGIANPLSMIAAIKMAAEHAVNLTRFNKLN